MANRKLKESIRIRELVVEALGKNILTIAAVREYVQNAGHEVTGTTVNKIMRENNYVPPSLEWVKEDANG